MFTPKVRVAVARTEYIGTISLQQNMDVYWIYSVNTSMSIMNKIAQNEVFKVCRDPRPRICAEQL